MGNPAILSTVHLLPNERPGQWHPREREYSPKLPNRGNLAIAVARMPRVTLRVWSGQCEWEHTRGAPGELLTPNRDLPSPLFLGQRWRELFTQRVLVHLFPKQPPPQRAGHPRPPIMPKSTALRYWLGTRKLRTILFGFIFSHPCFRQKCAEEKKFCKNPTTLVCWVGFRLESPIPMVGQEEPRDDGDRCFGRRPLSLSQCSKGRRWRENAREGGSIPHLAGPRGDATGDDHPRKHQIVVLSAAHRKMLKLTYNY